MVVLFIFFAAPSPWPPRNVVTAMALIALVISGLIPAVDAQPCAQRHTADCWSAVGCLVAQVRLDSVWTNSLEDCCTNNHDIYMRYSLPYMSGSQRVTQTDTTSVGRADGTTNTFNDVQPEICVPANSVLLPTVEVWDSDNGADDRLMATDPDRGHLRMPVGGVLGDQAPALPCHIGQVGLRGLNAWSSWTLVEQELDAENIGLFETDGTVKARLSYRVRWNMLMYATSCSGTVMISGAEAVQRTRMGLYTMVPGGIRGGRPVYLNGNDEYLFFSIHNRWLAFEDYDETRGGLQSADDAACPTDVDSWLAVLENSWSNDYTVTVRARRAVTGQTPPLSFRRSAFHFYACGKTQHVAGCVRILTVFKCRNFPPLQESISENHPLR